MPFGLLCGPLHGLQGNSTGQDGAVVAEDEKRDRQGGEGEMLKGADRWRGCFGEGGSKRCVFVWLCWCAEVWMWCACTGGVKLQKWSTRVQLEVKGFAQWQVNGIYGARGEHWALNFPTYIFLPASVDADQSQDRLSTLGATTMLKNKMIKYWHIQYGFK